MIYPGAFNMTTGPAHYQLLARGRAVDTQSYVASQHEFPEDPEGFYKLLSAKVAFASPARSSDKNDYQAKRRYQH